MVDQEIIDLPDDSAIAFDGTLFLPLQKTIADTRRRTLNSIISGFQTPWLQNIDANQKILDNATQVILRRDGNIPLFETRHTSLGPTSTLFRLRAFGDTTLPATGEVVYGTMLLIATDNIDSQESADWHFTQRILGINRTFLIVRGADNTLELNSGFGINMNDGDVSGLSNLVFASTNLAPLVTDRAIWYEDTEGMRFNALSGDFYQWDINGVAEMRLDGTQLQLSAGQNILLNDNADIQWGGSADRKIKNTTGGFEFEIETGDSFDYTIQDTTEYSYDSTQANFNGNNLVNLGTLNTHTIPAGTDTFVMLAAIQSLTNKTIDADLNTITNLALGAEVSGASTDLTDSASIARNTDNLSFFSPTTSAQLLALLSDETGTGLAVFGTNPTLIDPTITSMLNANHSHESAAEGGVLDATLALDATGTKDATTFLRGDNTWDIIPIPFTWAATDEDSPLSAPPVVLYVTEPADKSRTITQLVAGLKNAPTGTALFIEIHKETGVNTNIFTTIVGTIFIDVNEFTSQTAAIPPTITNSAWESGRRLQITLNLGDTNNAATGLKVTILA